MEGHVLAPYGVARPSGVIRGGPFNVQCVALGTASQGLAGRGALVPPPPPPEGGATPHDVTSQHGRYDPVPGQNAFFAEHDETLDPLVHIHEAVDPGRRRTPTGRTPRYM